MSASVLPFLSRLGPQAVKMLGPLGPLFIQKMHNLAVSELNRKVNSVTPRTNNNKINGIQGQIRKVINTTGISNNNKRKLIMLSTQLKNRALQAIK
jgi:hypothetical protein